MNLSQSFIVGMAQTTYYHQPSPLLEERQGKVFKSLQEGLSELESFATTLNGFGHFIK